MRRTYYVVCSIQSKYPALLQMLQSTQYQYGYFVLIITPVALYVLVTPYVHCKMHLHLHGLSPFSFAPPFTLVVSTKLDPLCTTLPPSPSVQPN
jgi:hypothetical protein